MKVIKICLHNRLLDSSLEHLMNTAIEGTQFTDADFDGNLGIFKLKNRSIWLLVTCCTSVLLLCSTVMYYCFNFGCENSWGKGISINVHKILPELPLDLSDFKKFNCHCTQRRKCIILVYVVPAFGQKNYFLSDSLFD